MRMIFGGWSRPSCAAAALAAALTFPYSPALGAPHDRLLVDRYADALEVANARLTPPARRDLAGRLLLLSSYYRIDPRLLIAVVTVESSWRARAVSPVGALGLGQLMPATAASLDVNALEPYENLDGTARYLRRLLNRYSGRDVVMRVRLAIASYNAGPAAVARFNGVPPYRETQRYVESVVELWQRLVARLDVPSPVDLEGVAAAETPRVAMVTRPAAKPRQTRIVKARLAAQQAWHPVHSPYLDAPDPNGVPLETPVPVVYERSRSFFARIFGLRHRVSPAAIRSPQPDRAALTEGRLDRS